jgi:hypothetical protein
MRILMIVEPDRMDWYHYLTTDTLNEYYLLWYESEPDIPVEVRHNSFFKRIYCWDDFTTPKQLLKKVQLDRIVFFEIIDQRQIALLVSANKMGIKTFYLEHGAAGNKEAAIQRANEENYFSKTKKSYLVNRIKTGFGRLIKSKIFYYSASLKLSSLASTIKFIRLPFSMLFNTPNKALAKCIFPERAPFRSIVFNKPNFEQFQVYTGITEDKAVFTGVPIFDHFYSKVTTEACHITYIEHPYLEAGILNWTPEHHKKIANVLYDFSVKRQIKILVKLHPRADISLWKSYGFESKFFQVVQAGDFTKEMLASKLILSYSSSLVNGFLCTQKNVVLLGWQPEPGIFGADFSKTGLCHISLHPTDLETKYDYWISHNLSKGKEFEYKKFLQRFNYPFDGKAGERVMRTITSDEIN